MKAQIIKIFRRSGSSGRSKSDLVAWIRDLWTQLKGRNLYGNVFCILSLLLLLAVIGIPLYLNYRSDKQTAAPLRVSVSVLRRQNLEILFQVSTVTVDDKDLNRGYVDMISATRLSIYNNDKNGCLLHFSGLGPPFEKALVSGLGSEVQVGAADAFVHQEYKKGTLTRTLNYKLYLSDDARPGTYPWPLKIALDEVFPE